MSDNAANISIYLIIFDYQISIHTNSNHVRSCIQTLFHAFETAGFNSPSNSEFVVIAGAIPEGSETYSLYRGDEELATGEPIGYILYLIEKETTIDLQIQRRELYFLHAAALTLRGKTALLIAPSGKGKSTTAWGLTNNGFCYLSDELAPIDVDTLSVFGYPRSLGLKTPPPAYTLPPRTLVTENSLHIDVDSLSTGFSIGPCPLEAIFILTDDVQERKTLDKNKLIEPITISSAVQHIYANSLNALAHNDKGLEAAIQIASSSPCYCVKAKQDLQKTCQSIANTLLKSNQMANDH